MLLKQKSVLYTISILAISSFFVFLSGHIAFMSEHQLFSYLHLYFEKVWLFAFPLLTAYTTLYITASKKLWLIFPVSLLFTFTSLFYYAPYRYEFLLLYEGYTSGEAIIVSLLYSLIIVCRMYIKAIVLLVIALLITKLIFKKDRCEAVLENSLQSVFDISTYEVLVSLIFSSLSFLLALATEIADTVSFLRENIYSATLTEVFTVIFNYLLLIVLLVLSHLLLVRTSPFFKKNF